MTQIATSTVQLFDGFRMRPEPCDILIENGRVGRIAAPTSIPNPDFRGGWVMPCVIDAHVHLTFSTPRAVLEHGVGGVLDLGAPLANAFGESGALRVRWTGPLLTAPGGYPTRSWGANGYGLEIASERDAIDAVSMLCEHGAAMIKIALDGDPKLPEPLVRAIVKAAHGRGTRTVAHALTAASVALALRCNIDALAHTPIETLPDETVSKLGAMGTTIVSTLRAFGDSPAALDNLTRLAAAGCTVVYGTDLGNGEIEPGVDPIELERLSVALGSMQNALIAATTAAARFAGFPDARIANGAPATLMLVDTLEPRALRQPRALWIEGERIV